MLKIKICKILGNKLRVIDNRFVINVTTQIKKTKWYRQTITLMI
jgi:hypothetical protein